MKIDVSHRNQLCLSSAISVSGTVYEIRSGKDAGILALQANRFGDLYAEYIYGMKNFIHDYSCLSEAEKDSLVLWDDYLIYAVILEKNKKIIEEMMQRRNGA